MWAWIRALFGFGGEYATPDGPRTMAEYWGDDDDSGAWHY